jgi:hypothetical protein
MNSRKELSSLDVHGGRIIKYAQDHCRSNIALMRGYHQQLEFFLPLDRKIT